MVFWERSAAARSLSHSWPVTAVLTPIAERLPRTWAVRERTVAKEMAEPPTVAAAKQTLRGGQQPANSGWQDYLQVWVAMSHVLGLVQSMLAKHSTQAVFAGVVMST